jgi:hypothetical protein
MVVTKRLKAASHTDFEPAKYEACGNVFIAGDELAVIASARDRKHLAEDFDFSPAAVNFLTDFGKTLPLF